jgi:hypothetical protein
MTLTNIPPPQGRYLFPKHTPSGIERGKREKETEAEERGKQEGCVKQRNSFKIM